MPDHPQYRRQSVTEASAWLDRWAGQYASEDVPLARAAGRRLAERSLAEAPWPQSRVAAVDGYAVIAAGTVGASDYSPLPYRLVDGSRALCLGGAVLLTPGEALPDNADAVLDPGLVEQHTRTLAISGTIAPGMGVITAGEEFETGASLLETGQRLRPQDLALLALAGVSTVPVVRRPRVRILLAGRFDRDANGPMLAAAVERDGGSVIGPQPVADADTLASALSSEGADLLIVSGGTGQGANDYAVATLSQVGGIDIYGVAMNPGESLALGRVGERPVIALPPRSSVGASCIRRRAASSRSRGCWTRPSASICCRSPSGRSPSQMRRSRHGLGRRISTSSPPR
jgi:molybdopterin molybdotransferase